MQFFCLLHNLRPRDPLWVSPEFLFALAGVVFPLHGAEVCVVHFLYLLNLNSCTLWSSFVCFHFSQGANEVCAVSEGEEAFKSHSARKPVCDFIRILLMDSLLNVSANSNTHPLVLLVEVNAHTHIHSCLWCIVVTSRFNRLLTFLLKKPLQCGHTPLSPEGATLCSVTA